MGIMDSIIMYSMPKGSKLNTRRASHPSRYLGTKTPLGILARLAVNLDVLVSQPYGVVVSTFRLVVNL